VTETPDWSTGADFMSGGCIQRWGKCKARQNVEPGDYPISSSPVEGYRLRFGTGLHRVADTALDQRPLPGGGNAGILYVTESLGHCVRRYDVSSTAWNVAPTEILPVIGAGILTLPQGIDVDADGNIYVVDTGNHRIVKFDASGAFVRAWGEAGRGSGEFVYPFSIALDDGHVYVGDPNNGRIQFFDHDGTFLGQWGSWVSPESGEAVSFAGCSGLAVRGSQMVVTRGVWEAVAMRSVRFNFAPRVHNLTQDSHHFTIQDAIDDAQENDEVVAEAGYYWENIDFRGRSLTLRGADPMNPAATVIHGRNADTVVEFGGAGSVLEGFTITNGNGGATAPGGIHGGAAGGMIRNCVITGNSGSIGGIGGCAGTILDCTITKNTGQECGGLRDCGTVIKCIVDDNKATSTNPPGYGGGLNNCGTVVNCTISDNSASYGAGASNGGNFHGCLIYNNSATEDGAALWNPLTVRGCTVAGNWANGNGGIMVDAGSTACIDSCIVWDNVANDMQQITSNGTVTVTYSCVGDDFGSGSGVYPGAGNTNSDPLFVAFGPLPADPKDLRLQWDSQQQSLCINAGNPNYCQTLAPDETDMAGHPRNWKIPVSMGAYESPVGLLPITPARAVVGKVTGNVIRLVFEDSITLPTGNPVTIQELFDVDPETLDQTDLAGSFNFSLATTNLTDDTLVIEEDGNILSPETWYRIHPAAGLGVRDFTWDVCKFWGDITGDGTVNVFDLQRLSASWNKQQGDDGYDPACDLTGDNRVNVFDLQKMAANWGTHVPPLPDGPQAAGEDPPVAYETWDVTLACPDTGLTNIVSYEWTQLAGATVVLTGADTATPSFTVPTLTYQTEQGMIFGVVVTDDQSRTATREVSVIACMMGDVDHDADVDQADVTVVKGLLGYTSQDEEFDPTADLDRDEAITEDDQNLVDANLPRTLDLLPPPEQMQGTGGELESSLSGPSGAYPASWYSALDNAGLLDEWLAFEAEQSEQ